MLIKKPLSLIANEDLLNDYKNEVEMLAKYRHPNIVLMVGAITTPNKLCIAMEMVKEGTLFELLHKRKASLSEADKRKICLQLISVISYLQRVGIVHRNLNSKDILVDSYYNVKLCGFGFAKHRVKND